MKSHHKLLVAGLAIWIVGNMVCGWALGWPTGTDRLAFVGIMMFSGFGGGLIALSIVAKHMP